MSQIRKVFNKLKRALYTGKAKRTVKSYKVPLYVNNKSYFTNNTILGKNTNFNGIEIGGRGIVRIGDNFHSGNNCLILTQNHNYEGNAIPYDDTYIVKDVTIEDNVWIGNNVIILGGVTIGEGAIIQAGAVVTSNIPNCAIAGGSPAKTFKYRDKKHYYKLKELNLFH